MQFPPRHCLPTPSNTKARAAAAAATSTYPNLVHPARNNSHSDGEFVVGWLLQASHLFLLLPLPIPISTYSRVQLQIIPRARGGGGVGGRRKKRRGGHTPPPPLSHQTHEGQRKGGGGFFQVRIPTLNRAGRIEGGWPSTAASFAGRRCCWRKEKRVGSCSVCAPRGGGGRGFWRRTEEVAKHTRAVQALVVAGTLPQFWGCFRTKKGEAGGGEGEKNKGSESYLCFR